MNAHRRRSTRDHAPERTNTTGRTETTADAHRASREGDHQQSVVPSRSGPSPAFPQRVAIEGSYNIRDVGGYVNRHGTPLQTGRFFRADNLGLLTPTGEEELLRLGVRTVIDLRTRRETNAVPNRFGRRPGVHYEPVDLVGDSHEIISRGDTIVARGQVDRLPDGRFADPVGRITTIYTTMLDHQRDAFRRVIAVLAARSVHSAVFHCVAGQDRTGLIAALLQSTADVDEETIVFDYAATARYNVTRFLDEDGPEMWGLPVENEEDYGSQFCPPGAMEGTLEHLKSEYGGAVDYLRTIGVTEDEIAAIRRRLLEP